MITLTVDEALSILKKGSLASYDDDCADIAIGLLEAKAPEWTKEGCLRADSPLKLLLEKVKSVPQDLDDGLKKRRQDVICFLSARRALWELGISLARLGLSEIRQEELLRLTSEQFWKSHYVLFLAALFGEKGLSAEFVPEVTEKTPDLKVSKWYIECKQRNDSTPTPKVFGGMFRKSKAKFHSKRYQPGIVALDIPEAILSVPSGQTQCEHDEEMAKVVFSEMSKINGVDATIVTIRRLSPTIKTGAASYPTRWVCFCKDRCSKQFRSTWSGLFRNIRTG